MVFDADVRKRMTDSTCICLVRHAKPQAADGIFLGSTEVTLGQEGHAQAKRFAEWFRGRQVVRTLLCSPMQRARLTAEPLAQALNLPVHIVDALREMDFGSWEGFDFQQVCARDPASVERWASGDETFAFPGGESLSAFAGRMAHAQAVITAADAPLVVCHGGVIRALLCRWLKLRPESRLAFQPGHAALTVIRWHGDAGVLEGFNCGP
jgi:broad specificity phosphatase PhoE